MLRGKFRCGRIEHAAGFVQLHFNLNLEGHIANHHQLLLRDMAIGASDHAKVPYDLSPSQARQALAHLDQPARQIRHNDSRFDLRWYARSQQPLQLRDGLRVDIARRRRRDGARAADSKPRAHTRPGRSLEISA